MELIKKPLEKNDIRSLKKTYGKYVKITADIEKGWLVIGPELHADGENILLDAGSNNKNIWGGGINLESKQIDTTAVLNLRPNLDNDSMEILDPEIRKMFINLVKEKFDINNG